MARGTQLRCGHLSPQAGERLVSLPLISWLNWRVYLPVGYSEQPTKIFRIGAGAGESHSGLGLALAAAIAKVLQLGLVLTLRSDGCLVASVDRFRSL